jgi:hypothetical protein
MSAILTQFWPAAAFVGLAVAVVGAAAAGVTLHPSGWLYRRRERRLAHTAWVARVRLAQDVQRYARRTRDDISGDGIPAEAWWRFVYELHRLNREMADHERRRHQ